MVCFLDDLYIYIYHIIYSCLRIEIQQGMISPASFRMISDLDLILAQNFFSFMSPLLAASFVKNLC